MNKELEEAIKRALITKHRGTTLISVETLETALNCIENSIPKEKVEDIIKRWKEKDYVYGSEHLIKVLQDLLEGK